MRGPTLVLVAFLAAIPHEAAAQAERWVVRDAEGALVGPVLTAAPGPALAKAFGGDSPLLVARRLPGSWLMLRMSRGAVWSTGKVLPFVFETEDCSGRAFLDAPQKTNEASATVVFDTEVFWPTGRGQTRLIRSKGVLVRDPEQCQETLVDSDLCCTAVEEEERFVAGISSASVVDLNLRPPFRLEAAAQRVEN